MNTLPSQQKRYVKNKRKVSKALEDLQRNHNKRSVAGPIKRIHVGFSSLAKFQSKYHMHILNEHPKTRENVIYAVNHSCIDDFTLTCAAIGRQAYVLVGKQKMKLIDRVCFLLNGVVWIDRKDKVDRKAACRKMKRLLMKKENICVYPEGTWNLTPSKPMLPLYWGVIDIAREVKAPIIPVIMEIKENNCYVQFGAPMYIKENDNKKDKIDELTDRMATMKWEIWEMFPVQSRENIDIEEWNQEVQRRLAEYPCLDYEYEQSCILKVYSPKFKYNKE